MGEVLRCLSRKLQESQTTLCFNSMIEFLGSIDTLRHQVNSVDATNWSLDNNGREEYLRKRVWKQGRAINWRAWQTQTYICITPRHVTWLKEPVSVRVCVCVCVWACVCVCVCVCVWACATGEKLPNWNLTGTAFSGGEDSDECYAEKLQL